MKQIQEEWIDAYANIIPSEAYTVQLESGEENGLVICLDGKKHQVHIDFGPTAAIQMLDEGAELNLPDGFEDSDSFLSIRRQGFPSTLYRVENSVFGQYIKCIMGENLYHWSGYREYRMVTMNYSISIASRYEPEIIVEEKKNSV